MKLLLRPWIAAVCFFSANVFASDNVTPPTLRDRINFDQGWRFAFGHATDKAKDFDHGTAYFSYLAKAGYGDGPAAPGFDDRAWRELDLPHDWAVEVPFASNGSHSHGYKAVGRNFPEHSVGWYRKAFAVPASDQGRRISIEFDGVFRDSVVWVNGFYLGRQPSGSTGFRYDLTDYLNYGGDNVIAVRADVTMEEGWYYEGAGIYRHVALVKTAPLHVPMWGTFVTCAMQGDSADVSVRTTVVNEGTGGARFVLEQIIEGPDGSEVARNISVESPQFAGGKSEMVQMMKVEKPLLWSVETPSLYRLITLVRSNGAVVDRYETSFGIRTVRFDPNQGFFLNGKHVLIKGVNLHQDHAGVGVALPDALHEYRLRRLKEMGCNAVRTSHEPPSTAFLAACDRLGILVLDENRLMGPSPEQLGQMEAMIRRDRNHPSVMLWSMGNEEWAIEGNEKGARISASMQAVAQRLDPTRRTTVAISGGWGVGSSTTADVMGYNYYTHGSTDEQHAKFPGQPGVGTEETTTQCTRGVYFADRTRGHLAHDPEAIGDSGGNCILGMKHFAARPYLAGLFYWTGLDYRGEPAPFAFPTHSTQFGLMDTCGFAKDSFYYLQAWWTDKSVLHLYPHWNWKGREGQTITVGCYTNHEQVELFLNGKSLGKKSVPQFDRVEWAVPYVAGVIEARGYRAGKLVETARVETTDEAMQLVLVPDRKTVRADGGDAVVISIEAQDAKGRRVPVADDKVFFKVAGGSICGVGNGDPSCPEADRFVPSYQLLPVSSWCGRIAPSNTTVPSGQGLKVFDELGHWKAPLPADGEIYEFAAEFPTPASIDGHELELFLPALGVKTSVWLNGREVLHDVDTRRNGPSLKLDAGGLVPGANRIQMLVMPFEDGRRRVPQQSRLGNLRITTPAPQPERSLFNGYAQVIVQSSQQSGEVRLEAEAKGLKSAVCTIKAVSVKE